MLELKHVLDRETSFMLLEPGERTETPADMTLRLRAIASESNSVVLVAEEGDLLGGYVEARGGEFRRNRHCAHVVMGVRRAFSGRGIGTALLRELSAWAPAHGIRRLELTVMSHNERALRLYRGSGFEIEGTRTRSLTVDGRDVDEIAMAKLFE